MFRKNKADKKLHKNRRFLKTRVKKSEVNSVSEEPVPRITNETVEIHREAVLKGARKYIYPLQHSKHKVVIFSVSIIVAVLIGFMSYVILNLYKWQNNSDFMYQVTKVLPLPVARIGGTFIDYENYLFDLKRYVHYFQSQQELDFNSEQGKAQLAEQKKKSIQAVVNFAYIKKIANQKGITVSAKEIDEQIELLKKQSKLGSDNKVFENVIKDFYGWDVSDFRRSIEREILTDKVIQAIDTKPNEKAQKVLAEIKAGKDFATLAKQYSEDEITKDRGGDIGLIKKNDNSVPPQTLEALFKLKAQETSAIINLGYGLEIVKNLGVQDGKIKTARIFFAYKDVDYYLNDYKDKQKAQVFIKT
jgi:flagellar basal body-associated protein FliL